MSVQTEQSRITVTRLQEMRRSRTPIACLTAYDAVFGRLVDEAGMDVVLVGDSLGMVVQGHETTVPVTLEQMIYHTSLVARGCRRALLMADMPFMSYTDPSQALANAARLMQEGGAQMVKLEGDGGQVQVVSALARHGIPVCAHLGLRPQSIHKLGGYRVQGRGAHAGERMMRDAVALQDAGADILLLECVPAVLAAEIRGIVDIPVIGIGAGSDCDGQILVLHDVLGLTAKPPRFARNFLQGSDDIPAALAAYVSAVRERRFPGPEHTFQN
ncbi:3-methyl-2-oxobutanoate hydroxymethyltransferase [Thioalkalivibrio denitrificans]|uniref:3-methyl-2-oxobutanoate hydroxymethyltransferase n=1 Tax=Thioalkalivibrio denitrificans TaxID=108003 RepID=A0A1V3NFX7_9GAMM|nr:3-methyl-2-oxobutanoate hydroxymethyltransferase [Thioalkalivibrio denitrificans]OOG23778.1 3-methyl-2-oxobutanoate hydroxymethyltransferase [Thioalkalivibrio denitrificans]